jgi:hypothetical protein
VLSVSAPGNVFNVPSVRLAAAVICSVPVPESVMPFTNVTDPATINVFDAVNVSVFVYAPVAGLHESAAHVSEVVSIVIFDEYLSR